MVGTLEDALMKRRDPDELSDFDREMIPATVRLDLPLHLGSRDLARSGDLLIALGNRLKALATVIDESERSLLFRAMWVAKEVRRKLLVNSVDSKSNKVIKHKILR